MYTKLLFLLSSLNNVASMLNLDERSSVIIKGPIDSESSNKFFLDLQNFDEEKLDIYIDSPGGNVIEGMKMIDHIHMLQEIVVVNCFAEFAASMAFIIFQSCDNRLISPSGILMQHQMSLGIKGDLQNLKNYLAMIDDINDSLTIAQAERLSLSVDEFNNKVVNDWWISGFSAKKLNVADNLTNIKCSPSLYKKNTKINKNSVFGNIEFTFSKCPLISNPIEINYNFSNDTIIDYYDKNKFLFNSNKIKEINI